MNNESIVWDHLHAHLAQSIDFIDIMLMSCTKEMVPLLEEIKDSYQDLYFKVDEHVYE